MREDRGRRGLPTYCCMVPGYSIITSEGEQVDGSFDLQVNKMKRENAPWLTGCGRAVWMRCGGRSILLVGVSIT